MKLLLTTNARLYKTPDGRYWTQLVYGYGFLQRYLNVFEEVKLVAHCEECYSSFVLDMLRVDGPGISVYEVPFPHGKKQYIKMYLEIQRCIKKSFQDCDAAILRIPDQLAFQIYPYLRKNNIPVGVEVTSDSWDFFSPGSVKSVLRPILRLTWHLQQKYVCRTSIGTSYVTRLALQKRYPPVRAIKGNGFTTCYTDADIDDDFFYKPRTYSVDKKDYIVIHISGSINGYAKGHKELIEAVGILSDKGYSIKLVLVGAGVLSDDINNLIEKYNLKEKIRYTGLITSQNELRNELIHADIFVFPSYREGLPRVVLEAMACGLPCVATDLPGIKELIDANYLVPVKNVIKLTHKVEKLITAHKRLTSISEINFEKAKEYSLNKIEGKRNQFYADLRKLL